MAGGSGERFWPLSREHRPKQLLHLSRPDQTLLEEAVHRIAPLVGQEQVYIATSRTLQGPIGDAKLVSANHLLAEPMRRNTLGALAWVAACLIAEHPNAWRELGVAVLTADHCIGEPDRFRETVRLALEHAAKTGGLGTIGIKPNYPETGFGYIEVADSNGRVRPVSAFREKPTREVAEQFVASGRHYWNSGMFFWTLGGFMNAMEQVVPDAASITMRMAESLRAGMMLEAEEAFAELPSTSIDYALMEKAPNVFVVEADFPWDDIGAWSAMERTMPLDESGNVLIGDTLALECEGVVLYNDSPAVKVCAVGASDLVVVVTPDAVLVCPKDKAQDVKAIVQRLKATHPHLT